MKFAVTISNPERVSYDEIKDVNYTKVFDDSGSLAEIMKWANKIRKTADMGNKKADVTDLKFSHVCE